MSKKRVSLGLWWEIATKPTIVKRALRVSILVGTILMVINHGDKILLGAVTAPDIIKMSLTFLVPYSVSTYSSVFTWIEEHNHK